MGLDEQEIAFFAGELLRSQDTGSSTNPITDSRAGLSLDDAYRIAAVNIAKRMARDETPVGWKIGFTNRTIWDEYDVHAPIWGPIYDTTIAACAPGDDWVDWQVGHLHEPRIEPEIAFRISRTPNPGMDEGELLGCLNAVAHGFEIVQSVFKGWRFKPADTVAAGALHGNFLHGPWTAIEAADHAHWRERLSTFSIKLFHEEGLVDEGAASNVLDGPLSALRHFVDGLAQYPSARMILPGDIVTTGTVTRAFPVAPGQRWSSAVEGMALPGLRIRLT